jgi:hypothetical protein
MLYANNIAVLLLLLLLLLRLQAEVCWALHTLALCAFWRRLGCASEALAAPVLEQLTPSS